MQIVVRLFGNEARVIGARQVQAFAREGITARELRWNIADQFPEHRALIEACRVAVNHDFAADEAVIQPGDEVALIGSVSGG
jgi:molybdopterin synthase catalytic subunit